MVPIAINPWAAANTPSMTAKGTFSPTNLQTFQPALASNAGGFFAMTLATSDYLVAPGMAVAGGTGRIGPKYG
ncbi:MAG: hypothetical protein AB1486_28665 [Planctomycetota bacterium]